MRGDVPPPGHWFTMSHEDTQPISTGAPAQPCGTPSYGLPLEQFTAEGEREFILMAPSHFPLVNTWPKDLLQLSIFAISADTGKPQSRHFVLQVAGTEGSAVGDCLWAVEPKGLAGVG